MNNNKGVIITLSILLILAIALGWLQHVRDSQKIEALSVKAGLYDFIAEKQIAADDAERALLKVTWPTAGTGLCYENQYGLSWQAPKGMDIVKIDLVTPEYDISLGQFPASNSNSNGVGYGNTTWDLTDMNGKVVPASKVYKLRLSGTYKGKPVSTENDGLFSVGPCN